MNVFDHTPRPRLASALLLALSAIACSGGSDSPSDGGLLSVGDSVSNRPAADASDAEIRANASRHAAAVLTADIQDTLNNALVGEPDGGSIDNANPGDEAIVRFLDASLGLGDSPAEITRQGDLITIDPADAAFCDQALQDLIGGVSAAANDNERCLEEARQISVQIAAITDDTGTISYFFQDLPWMNIAYSPASGSVEFPLPGYQRMVEYSAGLQGNTVTVPEALTGAILVRVDLAPGADTPTAERMSLHVSQPLRIVDSASNTDVAVGVSELIGYRLNDDDSIQINTDIQAVNMMFDVMSSEASPSGFSGSDSDALTPVDVTTTIDDTTTTTAEEITSYALIIQALTAQLDISADGDTRRLSNAGVGATPMQVMVDDETALTLSVNNMAFTIAQDTVAIDQDLTLGILLGNVLAAGFLDEDPALGVASAEATLTMPAGTRISEQADGSRRVDSGLMSAELLANGASGARSASFSAIEGDCFTESGATEDSALDLYQVTCD